MKFLSIRELRNSTQRINEYIASDGSLVITNNGKPAYVMLGIDEDNFEDTIIDIRRIKARQATTQIQKKAMRNGLDKLSMDDIDAEIKAARKERG
jgi:hypothetical protein